MQRMCFPLLVALFCLTACTSVVAQTLSILHSFQGYPSDGAEPNALVAGSDGNFYGTTQGGGTAGGGSGTVFKITPTGTIAILHKFDDGTIQNDGFTPVAGLVLGKDGNFYGTTEYGGGSGYGYGTIFKITPGGVETILHRFSDGTVPHDGALPVSTMVLGSDGNFYGTTTEGGSTATNGSLGSGAVFKMTPAGAVTVIHSFEDGTVPNDGYGGGNLVFGSDGALYGTSEGGGATYRGTFFKMALDGIETILYNFGDGTVQNDGTYPNALVLSPAGDFYGTTQGGGNASQEGTVFKITPTGVETILHRFGPHDGAIPLAALAVGANNDIYGTTSAGGPGGNDGTIFKIAPSGIVTIVHDFGDGSTTGDGGSPSSVIFGGDGNLYGTTALGGDADGTVFRMVPSSALTWTSQSVAASTDGTARVLWVRSDGAAGIWSMNNANDQSTVGQVYGPYVDGYNAWSAKAVKVASDGTARLLWTRSDGAAGVWNLSAAGARTAIGPTYGPYTGWIATDLATAPDGTSRVLWTRSDGAAGIWTVSANGIETTIGATYGPYSGWTAQAVCAEADSTSRILWNNSDGRAGVWSLDADDLLQSIGPTYGTYHGPNGLWVMSGIGASPNGQCHVLWTNPDGSASLWTFNATGAKVSDGPTYGPYSGWTPLAMDAADDQSRVLWVNTSRAAGVWTLGANDAESVIGSVYGPF